MNGKIKIIVLSLLLSLNISCFDDGSTSGPKGTLKITVITSPDLWGYPEPAGTDYKAYSGDTLYTWQYPETGGDGNPAAEENLSDAAITADGTGNKSNIIYIYSALGDKSDETPVLYKGESASNNQVITIGDITPGTYYAAAFYDYCGGGNLENMLNRYDRYALYTDTDPMESTANSTPFQDHATPVTIAENHTTEITLEIKRDWVIGKPKTTEGGKGRIFLKSTELIPTPDGTHP